MTTQFDCALGGVLLSSLDGRICVLDVHEDAPKLRIVTMPLHSGGQQLLERERESVSIHVRFSIHEENPIRRRTVLGAIQHWAEEGGYLTTTERPGLRLMVTCTSLPAMSGKDWTEELTLTFTTTHAPYWEDAEQTSASGTGEVTLVAPGTAQFAPVNAVIVNTTASTVTRLTVSCGDTQMTFAGISLPSGGQFALAHTSAGKLTARVGSTSVLHCRTADSSDDLLAPCGESCIASVSASVSLYAFFNTRGRYV